MAFVFYSFLVILKQIKIMQLPFIADKTYSNTDFTKTRLPQAEYDNCTFINCNFSEAYLSAISFLECEFTNCNLSGVKVKDASFNTVRFIDCKLLGIAFYECNPFLLAYHFENCNLNHSLFNGMNLTNSVFINSKIQDADFTETNLSKTIFKGSDLTSSIFENTILKDADFSLAKNYNINPSKNNLTRAKFSKAQIEGLLRDFKIQIV